MDPKLLVLITLCLSAGWSWAAPLRDFSLFRQKRLVQVLAADAVMKGLVFDRSVLLGAHFGRSRLIAARFENSDLIDVNFRGAVLRDARSERSRFLRCDFRGADLRGTIFVLSDLKDSLFDARTLLPFSRETALGLGMKYVD